MTKLIAAAILMLCAVGAVCAQSHERITVHVLKVKKLDHAFPEEILYDNTFFRERSVYGYSLSVSTSKARLELECRIETRKETTIIGSSVSTITYENDRQVWGDRGPVGSPQLLCKQFDAGDVVTFKREGDQLYLERFTGNGEVYVPGITRKVQ